MTTIPMTFQTFEQHILDNSLPFDLQKDQDTTLIEWMMYNAQHLKYYTTEDFLDIYMEYFNLSVNNDLANYDEAIEINAEYMEQLDLEKGLDIDDMQKDIKTFGYSDFMFNMSYDAW